MLNPTCNRPAFFGYDMADPTAGPVPCTIVAEEKAPAEPHETYEPSGGGFFGYDMANPFGGPVPCTVVA